MAGNPLASLPGLPQRPSLARSSASETRLTQPGIEAARSRKLNSAPTAAFRLTDINIISYKDRMTLWPRKSKTRPSNAALRPGERAEVDQRRKAKMSGPRPRPLDRAAETE